MNDLGNVGIGTTSPTHLLTLETASSPGLKIKDTTQGATLLAFSQDSNSHIGTYSSHPLVLDTNSSERMRITSAGNVGIGTTSPQQKLDVNGDIAIKTATQLSFNTSNGTLSVGGHAGQLDLLSSSIFINYTGDVGIGTTNPGAKLDVEGGAIGSAQGDSTTAAIFRAGRQNLYFENQRTAAGSDWNNNTFKILAKIDTTSHQSIDFVNDASYNEHIDIYTGNQSFNTRFAANGNVGIGTTSPQALLNLASDTSGLRIGNSTNSNYYDIQRSNTTGYLDFKGNQTTYSRYRFFTNSTNQVFTILNNGNTGIGTTNPTAKLGIHQAANNGNTGAFTNPHLKLSASATADGSGFCGITAATSTANNYGYSFGAQRTSGGVGDFKINYHNNSASGTNRFLIDQNGNVGIGTTSPGKKLHISSTDQSTARIRLSNTNTGSGGDNIDLVAGVHNVTQDGFSVYNATSNQTQLVIQGGGNVGIGTTSPAYQLQLSTNSAAKPTSSAWTVVSDERVKTNIRPYETGLQELLQIEPKVFDYNGKAGFDAKIKNNIGIIAQEVKDIIPETVKTYEAKLNENDEENTELYNFDGHALTFALINSVKELSAKIESLETKIQTLENQ
jgi:hypothetical protein